jgi:hypothetical protein
LKIFGPIIQHRKISSLMKMNIKIESLAFSKKELCTATFFVVVLFFSINHYLVTNYLI